MVCWFNPENDIALAVGAATYTPPAWARRLQSAGSALPLWYAHPTDQVLCYGVTRQWLKRMREDFGIKAGLFDHEPKPDQRPDPWGWSAYAKRYFQDEGFSLDVLPTDTEIERMRWLSHRRTAAEVAAELSSRLPDLNLAQPAYEARSIDEVKSWLSTHPKAYIKQPWSSSGRGVLEVGVISEAATLKMADDSIRLQGSVMLEPAYDRRLDFARIFECRDGHCHDLGTSVFTVDHRGGYTGNLIAPEARRLAVVGEHYSLESFERVVSTLREILEENIAPYYTGILGVDMLIDANGTLDAVVEINLRKTMGYVALRISEQYLHPDAPDGIFQVTRGSGQIPDSYTAEDHLLKSGALSLTPPNPYFNFSVTINESPNISYTFKQPPVPEVGPLGPN